MLLRTLFPSSGVLQISIASTLWGGAYFLCKLILSNVSPLLLSFLAIFFAALTLFLVFRPSVSKLVALFLDRPRAFCGLGVGNAIAQVSLLDALDHGALSSVILLERIQPIIGVFLAAFFLGEYIPRRRLPLVFVALLSSAFLAVKSPGDLSLSGISLRGVCGVIIAATGWAACTVIGRSLMIRGTVSASEVTIVRFLIALLLQLPFIIATNQLLLCATFGIVEWSVIFGCGSCATAGGYLLYMNGIKSVSAPVAGMLEILMPLTALLLGVCLLGESLSVWQTGAAVVMMWSIWLLSG